MRSSLLWKITLPFVILALAFAGGAALLVARLVGETAEDRFNRQLADSGQQAADAVVRAEEELLQFERLLANTQGVADALTAADAETLRALVLPLVVNADADVVSILDPSGVSLLSVRRSSAPDVGSYETLRGEAFYASWPFVSRILNGVQEDGIGDKHVGLHAIRQADEDRYVFFVGGPLKDASGALLGAVLVGEYQESLVGRLAKDSGANISIYDLESGRLLATTLEVEGADAHALASELIAGVRSPGAEAVRMRLHEAGGADYREAFLPLEARLGTQTLGILGVSLLDTLQANGSQLLPIQTRETVLFMLGLSGVVIALLVLFGYLLSQSITRPLLDLARASMALADGDLEVQVPEGTQDEVGVLSRSFNTMVSALRRSRMRGDPFDTTDSRLVASAPRHETLEAPGLYGSKASCRATILVAGIRLAPSEGEVPDGDRPKATVLGEIFPTVAQILSEHGGMLSRIGTEGFQAAFGLGPPPLPAQVSSLQAAHAGMELIEFIQLLNEQRRALGIVPLELSIGISTGSVVVRELEGKNGLNPVVFGATVGLAAEVERISHELNGGALLLSEDTYGYLSATKGQFSIDEYRMARLRELKRELTIYEVRGRKARLVTSRVREKVA